MELLQLILLLCGPIDDVQSAMCYKRVAECVDSMRRVMPRIDDGSAFARCAMSEVEDYPINTTPRKR